MFTGLIEEVGVVAAIAQNESGSRMTVSAQIILEKLALGDSIAIDGACMTVVAFDEQGFSFEATPESLSKTHFSRLKPGRRVNLERPLTPESRIGGHYVTGHVDGTATIASIVTQGNSRVYTFTVRSPELFELLVSKGSVAVLGISLTVNTVETKDGENRFSVAIIPHTLAHTSLGDYQPGDTVNIETDLLGKYVRRLLFERQTGSQSILESGSTIDIPTLAPAMNALTASTGAKIHTGSWFCHDPE